jgi:hypothetical protein
MTIRQRMQTEWQQFSDRLAEVLQRLSLGQFLILTVRESGSFVQVISEGDNGCRIETTSNYYRSDAEQLSERQIAMLGKLGWQPPTSPDSNPSSDPFGSPNFYLDVPNPVDADQVAHFIVQTLTEVLGATSPSQLTYEADDGQGQPLSLPLLGLDSGYDLAQVVLQTVKEITGQDDIEIDSDGVIGGVVLGDAVIYLKVMKNSIRLFSRIAKGITASQALPILNMLNGERSDTHFYCQNGTVIAMANLPTEPFINIHLARFLPEFCSFADYSISVLHAELAADSVVVH